MWKVLIVCLKECERNGEEEREKEKLLKCAHLTTANFANKNNKLLPIKLILIVDVLAIAAA